MNKPLFSIITICLNAQQYIEDTMKSVLAQDYKNLEYIIIDGASTDGTIGIVKDILEHYEDNLTAKVISEPDKGISDAFNKGIIASEGEYLLFLNAGDYFIDKTVLTKVSRDMVNNPAEIFIYSDSSLSCEACWKTKEDALSGWKKAMIPHQATFIKKDVFERIGHYDLRYKIRMDYDFFARCVRDDVSVFVDTTVITRYDMGGVSSINHFDYDREGLAIKLQYNMELDSNDLLTMGRLLDNPNKESNLIFSNDIEEQLKVSGRVIVYGAGLAGYHLFMLLREQYSEKVMVCDTFKAGHNIPEFAISVSDPDELINEPQNDVWVISVQNTRIAHNIYGYLVDKKIESKSIFFYDENKHEIC